MRAAFEILLLGLVTFAAAFVIRRAYFWDVMPLSWDHPAPQNGTLEAAYFLLTVENIAGCVAAIALAAIGVLYVRRWRQAHAG